MSTPRREEKRLETQSVCPAGTPNFLDLDSDNDQIPDRIECRCWEARATLACGRADDADEDGVPNYLDLDSDIDGLLDGVEGTEDDNGNCLPNYVDPFSASDNGQRVLIDSDDDGNIQMLLCVYVPVYAQTRTTAHVCSSIFA